MRWHRLQILMDRVKSDIEDQSYYLSTADGTVLQRQVSLSSRSELQELRVLDGCQTKQTI